MRNGDWSVAQLTAENERLREVLSPNDPYRLNTLRDRSRYLSMSDDSRLFMALPAWESRPNA